MARNVLELLRAAGRLVSYQEFCNETVGDCTGGKPGVPKPEPLEMTVSEVLQFKELWGIFYRLYNPFFSKENYFGAITGWESLRPFIKDPGLSTEKHHLLFLLLRIQAVFHEHLHRGNPCLIYALQILILKYSSIFNKTTIDGKAYVRVDSCPPAPPENYLLEIVRKPLGARSVSIYYDLPTAPQVSAPSAGAGGAPRSGAAAFDASRYGFFTVQELVSVDSSAEMFDGHVISRELPVGDSKVRDHNADVSRSDDWGNWKPSSAANTFGSG